MAGRPDFTTPRTEGSQQTITVNNRPEVKGVNADTSETVSSSEVREIYAPSGSVYNVFGLRLLYPKPSGATTGSHRVVIQGAGGARQMYGESDYDSAIQWDYSEWQSAPNEQRPADTQSALIALSNLKATENTPIRVNYFNETDVDQTGTRELRFAVEEVSY